MLSFHQKCFGRLQTRQIHFHPKLCPGARLEALDAPSELLVGWGASYLMSIHHPIRRLWRIVLVGAYVASTHWKILSTSIL